MARLKLKVRPSFDFILIGLVTSEPIYRISWLINEKLNIQLKEVNSLKIYNTKKLIIQEFPRYSFFANEEFYYYLIHNKGEQGILLEEQKQVDYFIKIDSEVIDSNKLVSELNSLSNVNLTFNIPLSSLKTKSKLLFVED